MTVVTEIETVDGDYCFTLRDDGQDFVLFGFPTEAEANVARDAIRQIVQHASVILPIAPSSPAPADAAVSTDDPDGADQPDSVDRDGKLEATSPFSR